MLAFAPVDEANDSGVADDLSGRRQRTCHSTACVPCRIRVGSIVVSGRTARSPDSRAPAPSTAGRAAPRRGSDRRRRDASSSSGSLAHPDRQGVESGVLRRVSLAHVLDRIGQQSLGIDRHRQRARRFEDRDHAGRLLKAVESAAVLAKTDACALDLPLAGFAAQLLNDLVDLDRACCPDRVAL